MEVQEFVEEEDQVADPCVDVKYSPIPICKCLTSQKSSEKTPINPRKQQIYTTASRTEAYLAERRIAELVRFLMTKIITSGSKNPVAYLELLLDECMLYRSGIGLPPVLYEDRHLEAIVKSYDPGNRGSLSPAQIRRVFTTVGLTPIESIRENTPNSMVLELLKKQQEMELYRLVASGTVYQEPTPSATSSSLVNSGSFDITLM